MVRFDGIYAFGYKFAGSEPIWMTFGTLAVHCLPLTLVDFGRDLRRSKSERARRSFVFLVMYLTHDFTDFPSAKFQQICTQDVDRGGGEFFRNSAVCRSVCLSLCQSVTLVSPAETAETIKLPFEFRTPVGPMNHVLHEVQMPTCEGAILSGNRQTIVKYRDTPRSSVQTRLNRSRCRLGCGLAWAQGIMCYMGVQIHPFEGAILVDRAPIVNCTHFLLLAVQNGLTDRFAVWVVDLSGPKDAQIQSYSPGGARANVPTWRITLVIFGHAHLDSLTDSQALRG